MPRAGWSDDWWYNGVGCCSNYACNGTNDWFSGGYRYCGRRAASADWWTQPQQPPTENNNGWDCIILWFKWSHIMSPCDTSGCKRIRTTCSVQDETSRLHQRLHMLRTLRIGSMELRGRLYRNVQKADPDLSRTVIVNIQSLVANCLNWDLPMMWWISLGQADYWPAFSSQTWWSVLHLCSQRESE